MATRAPADFHPRQQLNVAHALAVRDARDVGNARPDAGGDDDLIKIEAGEHRCARARVETQGNAEFGHARAKVAQRFVEFLLAWNRARQIELPTDARRGLKQRDAHGRARRRSRRRPALPVRRRRRRCGEPGLAAAGRSRFAPSLGIDETGCGAIGKDQVQTGLVAGDAHVDLSRRPSRVLLANSGSASIGRAMETRSASPRARMASASSGVLMRFEATTGMRTASFRWRAAKLQAARGTRRRNGRHARLVPADALVDDVGAGRLDSARKRARFPRRQTAFDQVDRGDAKDDEEVAARPLAHAAHHFDCKSAAGFRAMPPQASLRSLQRGAVNSLMR